MEKSKKSMRPLIIGIAVLGLIAASSAIFYNAEDKFSPSTKEETALQVQKPEKEIAYLDLNVSPDGLLKDQVIDVGVTSPDLPNYLSKTDFSTATPSNDIYLQEEFLDLFAHEPARRDVYFASRYVPLVVDVFGDIGKTPLVGHSSRLHHVRFDGKSDVTPFIVTFSTRLNNETGQIFWHRLQKSSGKDHVDRLAESLLKSLKFAKDNTGTVSRGEVSLVINLERGVNFQKQLLSKLIDLEDIAFDIPMDSSSVNLR